jgi:hypothetical protein
MDEQSNAVSNAIEYRRPLVGGTVEAHGKAGEK